MTKKFLPYENETLRYVNENDNELSVHWQKVLLFYLHDDRSTAVVTYFAMSYSHLPNSFFIPNIMLSLCKYSNYF